MAQNTQLKPQTMPENATPAVTDTPITANTENKPLNIVKEAPEETVTLKKSELDSIMASIKRLEFAADKAHLAHFDAKNRGDFNRTVKLRILDGKVITSWDPMPVDNVEKTPQGKWIEEQKVKLNFEDKTSTEMDLVIYNRRFTYLPAEILGEVKVTENGEERTTLKLQTADGRHYEIDQRFVN